MAQVLRDEVCVHVRKLDAPPPYGPVIQLLLLSILNDLLQQYTAHLQYAETFRVLNAISKTASIARHVEGQQSGLFRAIQLLCSWSSLTAVYI